jgi:hypothetical protein
MAMGYCIHGFHVRLEGGACRSAECHRGYDPAALAYRGCRSNRCTG